MGTRGRAMWLGVALLVGLALAPGSAVAATASVESDVTTVGRGYRAEAAVVRYEAAPGERNSLTASAAGTSITLVDPAGIQPGSRCRRPSASDATRVVCDVSSFNRTDVDFTDAYPFLHATLGDQADAADIPVLGEEPDEQSAGVAVTVALDGGAGEDRLVTSATSSLAGGTGNDTLRARERAARLAGGPGDDSLNGGPAEDVFEADATADGADVMAGGRGADLADYSDRGASVRANLDGVAGDGERGEGDRIDRDVEDLAGGRGADRLTGDRRTNVVRGGGGNDRLQGGSGGDTLDGGSGRDRIRARDGSSDVVRCGRGRDVAALDGLDLFGRCERARRSSAARALIDPTGYSYQEGRIFNVSLTCPRDAARICRGLASIRRGPRTLGARRFAIRRGRGKDLRIRIQRQAANAAPAPATLVLSTRARRRPLRARFAVAIGRQAP